MRIKKIKKIKKRKKLRERKRKSKGSRKKEERSSEPFSIDKGVSQSAIKKMMRCRQELQYSLDGWRPVKAKTALAFGGLEHDILEDLYGRVRSGKIEGMPTAKQLRTILKTAEKKAMKKAEESSSPGVLEETEVLMAWAEALLEPYCEFWNKDFDPKIWVDLESKFDVDWKGFRLKGRRDALRIVKKSLWLLETKTKAKISETILTDALSFDFQNEFYITGTDAELEADGKEERIKGVLYNIVRRPNLKQKVEESIKQYANRVKEDVKNRPDHYFKRFEISYPEKEKKRFQSELLMKLKEFQMILEGKLPIYRCETSCEGRWNCDYLPACASGTMVGYQKRKFGKRNTKGGDR